MTERKAQRQRACRVQIVGPCEKTPGLVVQVVAVVVVFADRPDPLSVETPRVVTLGSVTLCCASPLAGHLPKSTADLALAASPGKRGGA